MVWKEAGRQKARMRLVALKTIVWCIRVDLFIIQLYNIDK